MSSEQLKGFATVDGTNAYAREHALTTAPDFYKVSSSDLHLSSIGLGTYVGEATAEADSKYLSVFARAFECGINVVDTAIKYRQMRSEKTIGAALQAAVSTGVLKREQVFISSKGGIICLPEGKNSVEYIEFEIMRRLNLPESSITHNSHCIEPEFLRAELHKSLANLGLETLDCYFVHNPETALFNLSSDDFYKKMGSVFAMLEEEVAAGSIRAYGVASWKGFRAARNSQVFIDLARLHSAAEAFGANHNFRFLEMPLSVGMPTTFAPHAQRYQNESISALQLARKLGLTVFTSGSVYEGRLAELKNLVAIAQQIDSDVPQQEIESLAVSLPRSSTSLTQLFQLLWGLKASQFSLWEELSRISNCQSDSMYVEALDVVRSLPEVTTALIGCEEPGYLEDHLELLKVPTCNHAALQEFWNSLSRQTED